MSKKGWTKYILLPGMMNEKSVMAIRGLGRIYRASIRYEAPEDSLLIAEGYHA